MTDNGIIRFPYLIQVHPESLGVPLVGGFHRLVPGNGSQSATASPWRVWNRLIVPVLAFDISVLTNYTILSQILNRTFISDRSVLK